MAVGDIVNGISGVNTVLTFQPAAGVECMITFIINGQNGSVEFTTGAITSRGCIIIPLSDQITTGQLKILISNSYYMNLAAVVGTRTTYQGIQIK